MKNLRLNMFVARVSPAIALLLASPAMAGGPTGNIPEPGMLPLLGLGAVVLVAIAIRNRRNKK